jgi:hypothetical protein
MNFNRAITLQQEFLKDNVLGKDSEEDVRNAIAALKTMEWIEINTISRASFLQGITIMDKFHYFQKEKILTNTPKGNV